jgi:hypothetical protein
VPPAAGPVDTTVAVRSLNPACQQCVRPALAAKTPLQQSSAAKSKHIG